MRMQPCGVINFLGPSTNIYAAQHTPTQFLIISSYCLAACIIIHYTQGLLQQLNSTRIVKLFLMVGDTDTTYFSLWILYSFWSQSI